MPDRLSHLQRHDDAKVAEDGGHRCPARAGERDLGDRRRLDRVLAARDRLRVSGDGVAELTGERRVRPADATGIRELENPFGIDCNDLPTRAIAEAIRRQVHEILEVERHGRPDVEPATAAVYTKIF